MKTRRALLGSLVLAVALGAAPGSEAGSFLDRIQTITSTTRGAVGGAAKALRRGVDNAADFDHESVSGLVTRLGGASKVSGWLRKGDEALGLLDIGLRAVSVVSSFVNEGFEEGVAELLGSSADLLAGYGCSQLAGVVGAAFAPTSPIGMIVAGAVTGLACHYVADWVMDNWGDPLADAAGEWLGDRFFDETPRSSGRTPHEANRSRDGPRFDDGPRRRDDTAAPPTPNSDEPRNASPPADEQTGRTGSSGPGGCSVSTPVLAAPVACLVTTPRNTAPGEAVTVSFMIRESGGRAVTLPDVGVFVQPPDGSPETQLATHSSVTIPAYGSWTPSSVRFTPEDIAGTWLIELRAANGRKIEAARGSQNPLALVVDPMGTSTAPPCERTGDPGGYRYCSRSCPCGVGLGDCDRDTDCLPGLRCVRAAGPDYGFGELVDVCETDPDAEPAPEEAVDSIERCETLQFAAFDPSQLSARNLDTGGDYGTINKSLAVTWEASRRIDLSRYLTPSTPRGGLLWTSNGDAMSSSTLVYGGEPGANNVHVFRVKVSVDDSTTCPCAWDELLVVVIPRSTGTSFTSWLVEERARDKAWLAKLPAPHSPLGRDRTDPEPEDCEPQHWGDLDAYTGNMHPGAAFEMRSAPTAGDHAHQAMYDDAGTLLCSGVAAGSADFAAPSAWDFYKGHVAHDVGPFEWAAQLDANPVERAVSSFDEPLLREGGHLEQYLEVRPSLVPGVALVPPIDAEGCQ